MTMIEEENVFEKNKKCPILAFGPEWVASNTDTDQVTKIQMSSNVSISINPANVSTGAFTTITSGNHTVTVNQGSDGSFTCNYVSGKLTGDDMIKLAKETSKAGVVSLQIVVNSMILSEEFSIIFEGSGSVMKFGVQHGDRKIVMTPFAREVCGREVDLPPICVTNTFDEIYGLINVYLAALFVKGTPNLKKMEFVFEGRTGWVFLTEPKPRIKAVDLNGIVVIVPPSVKEIVCRNCRPEAFSDALQSMVTVHDLSDDEDDEDDGEDDE
jgi:hypothetical protein